MPIFIAAISGAVFGLGLLVSGMTDTAKIRGWLDFFGQWDPTLTFVMGGAILPMILAWAWMNRRERTLLDTAPPPPASTRLDQPLIWGAVIFGAGWGLSGFCPGPAMASATWSGPSGATFVAAMLIGMWLTPHILKQFRTSDKSETDPRSQ